MGCARYASESRQTRNSYLKRRDWLIPGKLRSIVNTIVPLAEARRAHELSQTGHVRGKIVLRIAQPCPAIISRPCFLRSVSGINF